MRRGIAAIAAVAGLGWLAASALGQTGWPAGTAPPVRTLTVPSETMVPTIPVGGKVEANFAAYAHRHPEIGDIVIVHPPRAAEGYHDKLAGYCGDRHRKRGQMCAVARKPLSKVRYIKRVAGLPGDRLSLRHGKLYRNGVAVDEPYTAACHDRELCHFPRTIRVPARHYYVLGDNRGESFDSRLWGPVPRSAFLARVERCTPQPAVGCDPRTP